MNTQLTLSDRLNIIFEQRDAISDMAGFDILDNQNYNTAALVAPMVAIDPSFDISMKRNGPDYTFVNAGSVVEGEAKASNLKGKRTGSWAFHALAVLANGNEDAFLFYTHRAGVPTRLYDIRSPEKLQAINSLITERATAWKRDVDTGIKNGKHDMIRVEEGEVAKLFTDEQVHEYDGRIKASVHTMLDRDAENLLIYSDHLNGQMN